MGMMNRKELAGLKPGERPKVATKCDAGKTKQEFAKECDINHILFHWISYSDQLI